MWLLHGTSYLMESQLYFSKSIWVLQIVALDQVKECKQDAAWDAYR